MKPTEAIAEFAFENFTSPETGKLRMFHLVSAYFDPSVSIPSKSLVSGLLKFYGGTIVESLQPGVTHVIARYAHYQYFSCSNESCLKIAILQLQRSDRFTTYDYLFF